MGEPLRTIGLWGDGDEIDAIADVERRLGFKLPTEDASLWFTAGDVYDSIIRHRPDREGGRTWIKLRVGLCQAVGVNPRSVGRATTLIERTSIWRQLAGAVSRLGKNSDNA